MSGGMCEVSLHLNSVIGGDFFSIFGTYQTYFSIYHTVISNTAVLDEP